MFVLTNAQGLEVIDFTKYEHAGLYLNDKGYLEDININAYARHLRNVFEIAIRYDSRFYQHKDKYFQLITDLELRRILYDYFNFLIPDGWSLKLENAYLEAYKRVIPRAEDLITGDEYANLVNGLFSFNDWKLHPHSKKIFTTTRIPVTYNENSECPTFIEFLFDVFNNDESLVNLIQELMGYTLTNATQAHRFCIMYGRGRNGKSVLLNIITALVGKENVSNITLKSFGAPFELANIVDKRVNIASESDLAGASLKTDKIKAIVAGDSIQINPKNEKPFSHTPITKLIFAVNQMPSSTDTSEGFTDRLMIIPFDKKYVANPQNEMQGKRDPNLTDKLLKELDGIFIFALEGLKRLIQNDYVFTESKRATQMLNQFVATNNPYFDFIDSRLCEDRDARVPRTIVFDNFKQWVDNQGFRHFYNIKARSFYADLEAELNAKNISIRTIKVRGILYFKGIKMASNLLTEIIINEKKPVQSKSITRKAQKSNIVDLTELLEATD
jgi:putative DNA primase/helicase